jgi:hypothetical protein
MKCGSCGANDKWKKLTLAESGITVGLMCEACGFFSVTYTVEAEPTPVYGAPFLQEKALPLKIKEWNLEHGENAYKDILLIRRLKEILDNDTEKVSDVLELLENICTSCWNKEGSCQCWNDE